VEIIEVESAQSALALMEALGDQDDVQNVSANFTIPDATSAAIATK
jgi:transcriptional/translational regulatory protein YebC/TACO1